ncbi:glycosyltransferase, partial [Streptomyces mirabilis]
ARPGRIRRGAPAVGGRAIDYRVASARGLPVVGGDSGGAPDAVLDGETGWVVRGDCPDDSADRIITLLADPELRRHMGERGREWVERKWRWDLLAESLKELL